jgi:peptidoglycan/LPS O-acetylase OafA/YrhL
MVLIGTWGAREAFVKSGFLEEKVLNDSTEEVLPTVRLGSAAKSKAEFLHRLESLRGMAALMVAGCHSFDVLKPHGWQQAAFTGIRIRFNGGAAVILFFVLSGLVLGLSLERSKEPFGVNYGLFCVRRILRICPAHWIALLVITAAILNLDTAISYPAGVSTWATYGWDLGKPITPVRFLENCFFQYSDLNGPTWSLKIEIICSFVLPVLVLISQRFNWIGRAFLLALLIAVSVRADGLPGWGNDWIQRLYLFYLGYLVPTFGSVLARLRAGTLISRWAPSLALAILLSWDGFGWGSHWLNGLIAWRFRWSNLLIEGLMAGVFVSFLYHGHETGWFRVFDWPIARFYGKISYSFYLYHMVILYFVTKLAIRSIPTDVLMAQPFVSCLCFFLASTAIATLLGWLSYRAVEIPAIRFSKELGRILRPKPGVVMPSTG